MADNEPPTSTTSQHEPTTTLSRFDPIEAELTASVERKRRELGISQDPTDGHVRYTLADIGARIMARPDPQARPQPTPEQIEAHNTANESNRRREAWERLAGQVGKRYENCTVENYKVTNEDQSKALRIVMDFMANMPQHTADGQGIFFGGPVGTGKDHLLTACMRCAILTYGYSVEWRDSIRMFGHLRSAIGAGKDVDTTIINRLAACDILALSDPVPPGDVLSSFQLNALRDIIDQRNRAMRPTWVTVNTGNKGDTEKVIGAGALDRLRHGAVRVYCKWTSAREPAK